MFTRTRSAFATVVALVAAVLATLLMTPANATVTGTTNFPVTLSGAEAGQQVPLTTVTQMGSGFYFTARGMTVKPSPLSSELQHVRIDYRIESRPLGWQDWQTTVATKVWNADLTTQALLPDDINPEETWIDVASAKTAPSVQFPVVRTTTTREFRLVVTVNWFTQDRGVPLGATILTPTRGQDLKCDGGGLTKCSIIMSNYVPMFMLKP